MGHNSRKGDYPGLKNMDQLFSEESIYEISKPILNFKNDSAITRNNASSNNSKK